MFSIGSSKTVGTEQVALGQALVLDIASGSKPTPCPPETLKAISSGLELMGRDAAELRTLGILTCIAAVDNVYNRSLSLKKLEDAITTLQTSARAEFSAAASMAEVDNGALIRALNKSFEENRPELIKMFLPPSLTVAYGLAAESLGFEVDLKGSPREFPEERKLFLHLRRNGESAVVETSMNFPPFVNPELDPATMRSVSSVELINAEISAAMRRANPYDDVSAALDVVRLILNPGDAAAQSDLEARLQTVPQGLFDALVAPPKPSAGQS